MVPMCMCVFVCWLACARSFFLSSCNSWKWATQNGGGVDVIVSIVLHVVVVAAVVDGCVLCVCLCSFCSVPFTKQTNQFFLCSTTRYTLAPKIDCIHASALALSISLCESLKIGRDQSVIVCIIVFLFAVIRTISFSSIEHLKWKRLTEFTAFGFGCGFHLSHCFSLSLSLSLSLSVYRLPFFPHLSAWLYSCINNTCKRHTNLWPNGTTECKESTAKWQRECEWKSKSKRDLWNSIV